MTEEQERAAVPTWRAFKVAPVAGLIMARHRESVPGVALIERDLVPALEVFVRAATALRVFDATRVVIAERHEQHLGELRRRTRFWLTYVRLDLPGYAANDVEGSHGNAAVVVDRARKLIDVADSYNADNAPHYLAQMLVEMTPLHDRSARERVEWQDNGTEQQRLQREVRTALAPVSEGLVTLRVLLRNALGKTHADVRAIDIDPPKKRKKHEAQLAAEEAAAADTNG